MGSSAGKVKGSNVGKIKKINIQKFRHLDNLEILLGSKITIISGGNGTGKTSVLGLLSHIFTSTSKSLNKRSMSSKFSEVFRFSEEHDKGGSHVYSVSFEDGSYKQAQSRSTLEKGKSRFRIDVGSRESESGKISRPLMYLGLKRLIPLAQERESTIKLGVVDELTDELKSKYQEYHNKIFSVDYGISPTHTRSSNKLTYSPVASHYDAHGISAGQDNIGQIIIALLSFYELKNNSKSYDGGLLVIDEIDATLYPAAQKNLLDLMLKECGKLNLQIVFTTHSTDLLKHVLEDSKNKFANHCEMAFLDNSNGTVVCHQAPDYLGQVLANLNHTVYVEPPIEKTNIYFEDEEARIFFRFLISVERGLFKKLKIQSVNLGESFYKSLLSAKFPEFNKSIIILDGDARSKLKGQHKPKVCFLPGLTRPENVLYDFLSSLEESDHFWDNGISGYKKQVFIQNKPSNVEDRNVMKNWFLNEKKYWGNGSKKLFKRWMEESGNKKSVDKFLKEFNGKLDKVRNN